MDSAPCADASGWTNSTEQGAWYARCEAKPPSRARSIGLRLAAATMTSTPSRCTHSETTRTGGPSRSTGVAPGYFAAISPTQARPSSTASQSGVT